MQINYNIKMLGQVIKKYQNTKKNSQKQIESTKLSLQQLIEARTIQALKIQNHKVSKIHSNQQQIENRLRRNLELQAQLKLHVGGWILLYDELNKSLKEAGDLVNYAQYVQEEMRQINKQLQQRMLQQKQTKNHSSENSLQIKQEQNSQAQTVQSKEDQNSFNENQNRLAQIQKSMSKDKQKEEISNKKDIQYQIEV